MVYHCTHIFYIKFTFEDLNNDVAHYSSERYIIMFRIANHPRLGSCNLDHNSLGCCELWYLIVNTDSLSLSPDFLSLRPEPRTLILLSSLFSCLVTIIEPSRNNGGSFSMLLSCKLGQTTSNHRNGLSATIFLIPTTPHYPCNLLHNPKSK